MARQAGKGNPIKLATDIVIIGSGAGGGVVAAELAQAGHKVLVLEKAPYRHHTDLSMNELDSVSNLYERGGALQSENGGIQILAAKAWGGGTFVNWSASLRRS